jgi:hypothetical protein
MGETMSDDVYQELPRELTSLLRDPRVVLPGEMETMDRVHAWVQAPTFSNVGAPPLLGYVGPQSVRSLTGSTSG